MEPREPINANITRSVVNDFFSAMHRRGIRKKQDAFEMAMRLWIEHGDYDTVNQKFALRSVTEGTNVVSIDAAEWGLIRQLLCILRSGDPGLVEAISSNLHQFGRVLIMESTIDATSSTSAGPGNTPERLIADADRAIQDARGAAQEGSRAMRRAEGLTSSPAQSSDKSRKNRRHDSETRNRSR